MRRLLACVTVLVLAACSAPGSAAPGPTPPPHRAPVAEGGMCGGFAGFQCEAGLTCQLPAGACRKVADASGTCRKAPQICPMIYQPVCGCDGKTYGNVCQASAKGVSVAAIGACQTS